MEECIFCRTSKEDGKVLYKDKTCHAILDKNPAAEAHTLIISNGHFKSITDAPDETVAHMFVVAKRLSKKIDAEFRTLGGTVLTNRGPGHIPHFHIHLIPKYAGAKTVDFPRGRLDEEKIPKIIKRFTETEINEG